jgi:phenylacetate-CoA ligase
VCEAYHGSAFYRDLYDTHGVRPADIRGYGDLARLPLVDKEMLRSGYPEKIVMPTRYRTKEYSTSGSTGVPFRLLLDDDTMSRARALMILRTLMSGWRLGEPVFQTGMALQRGAMKSLKDRVLGVHYFSAYDLTTPALDRCLATIDRKRLRYLTGYAQSLYLLAERAKQVGFNHRCRAAVTWGSNLHRHFREGIREAFGCPTFDSYGVGEGMQIAAQSVDSGDLYHQFCLHAALEIVDEGVPVPAGERGEIVLTRLNSGAMPLIRYRIGDVGRLHDKDEKTGTTNLPLLAGVDGRISDIVTTPGGNQLIVEFFFGIFQDAPNIRLFQVTQPGRGKIHVQIVPGPEFRMDDWHKVESEILTKGDPDLAISMEQVKDIPLEKSGKRRFVISQVP